MKKRCLSLVILLGFAMALIGSGCQEAPPQASAPEESMAEESLPEESAPEESEPEESVPEASESEESEPEESEPQGIAAVEKWAPPLEGLRWGMTVDEAVAALGCETYETNESDKLLSILLPDGLPSPYGVELTNITLGFSTDDGGIPGNDGLVTVNAVCAAEETETLKAALDETYADYRKTDDAAVPIRWESEALRELDNAAALEEAARAALTQALGEEADVDVLLLPIMGSPAVSYSLFTSGQPAGLLMTDGSNQVLREALES